MAIHHSRDFVKKKEYVLNHFRHKKLRAGHLITTDYGSWAYLSQEDYKQLMNHSLNESMFNDLKEKGIILTNDNVDGMVGDYRKKLQFLFRGTALHIIIPTLRCNLKCIYCHSRAESLNSVGYDMDKKTARKTVDLIFQSPSNELNIEFQGGEPLLRFDIIKEVISYARQLNKSHKKDVKFHLVTNLTLMKDSMLEYLLKVPGIGMCTSLDGPEPVHNKNRQGYEKTVYWIKRIRKKHDLNAMTLITYHSLGYHNEIVEEFHKLGFNKVWIKPVNNLGFATNNWQQAGITAEEFLSFWKKALKKIITLNKQNVKLRENYTFLLLRKIMEKDCVNFLDLQSPCGAAIGQLAYNYDGSVYTCDEGRFFDIFKLGTVNDSYSDILSSKGACGMVKASINDTPLCETCAYKPYCGLCPVCSYAETGNIISNLPDRRCTIFKGMFDHIFDKLLFDKDYKAVFMNWLKNSEKYK